MGTGFTPPPAGHLEILLLSGTRYRNSKPQPGVCENAMLLERGIHLAWVVVEITLDLASESLRQKGHWLWGCRTPSFTSMALPFPWMALSNTLISSSRRVETCLTYFKWENAF